MHVCINMRLAKGLTWPGIKQPLYLADASRLRPASPAGANIMPQGRCLVPTSGHGHTRNAAASGGISKASPKAPQARATRTCNSAAASGMGCPKPLMRTCHGALPTSVRMCHMLVMLQAGVVQHSWSSP